MVCSAIQYTVLLCQMENLELTLMLGCILQNQDIWTVQRFVIRMRDTVGRS